MKIKTIQMSVLLGMTLSLVSGQAKQEDAEVTVYADLISIKSEIFIYGKGATRDVADAIKAHIVRYWYQNIDGKPWNYVDSATHESYSIKFDVRVSLYNEKEKQDPTVIWDAWNPPSRKNYFSVTEDEDYRSNVVGGYEGNWIVSSAGGLYAHEFGHFLGLTDRYADGPDGYSVPNPGWEMNIMATSGSGVVEQRNIDAIAKRILSRARNRQSGFGGVKSGQAFHDSIDIDDPAG